MSLLVPRVRRMVRPLPTRRAAAHAKRSAGDTPAERLARLVSTTDWQRCCADPGNPVTTRGDLCGDGREAEVIPDIGG